MQKAIERIINILPIPVIFALSLIFVIAWLLKEIRGYESFGDVFRYSVFQISTFLIIVGLLAYYGINLILKLNKPKNFSKNEIGIVISTFEGDENNDVQRQTSESLITEIDNIKKFSNVKVERIQKLFKSHDEVCQYNISSGASLCIWGAYIPPSTVHFNMSAVEQENAIRFMVPNFPDVSLITHKVKEHLNSIPPTEFYSYQQRINYLENQLEEEIILNKKSQLKINELSELIKELQIERIGKNKYKSEISEIKNIELQRKRIILIIGIDTYKSHPSLSFSTRDAHAINELLIKIWPNNTRIKMLLNSNASRYNILKTMDSISSELSKDDQFWIYYSGHAFTDNETGYLLPYDGKADQLLSSAISMSEFGNWFKNLRAKQAIMLVDACFSGRFSNIVSKGLYNRISLLRSVKQGEGRVILTAGGPNDAVFEDRSLKNSLFTHFLIKGLSGEADIDNDSIITRMELFEYLTLNVVKYSAEKGFMQHPVMYSELKGELVLAISSSQKQL